MRTIFSNVGSLAAVFAMADLYGLLGSNGDVQRVIGAIRAQVSRARDEAVMLRESGEQRRPTAHAAKGHGKDKGKEKGKAQGNSDKVCTYCGRRGH